MSLAWALPIIGEDPEGGTVGIVCVEGGYIVDSVVNPGDEPMPAGAKVFICSYAPLLWVVSPVSFHLEQIGYSDYYRAKPWSWLLMIPTFIIGIGVLALLFWWITVAPKKTWLLAAKTVLDWCLMLHLGVGVVFIVISLL